MSLAINKAFRVMGSYTERERCYARWGTAGHSAALASPASIPQTNPARDALTRFANVPIRPNQAAFRKAAFLAKDGRYAIPGCDVPEALEAAHLVGGRWRDGYNKASDGVLRRRDLHALYDAGLLTADKEGVIRFHPQTVAHDREYDGRRVPALRS